ncbi:PIN domain-containing protein [Rhizobium sp. BE258]|uniref:PIN domain-containing protein n=1 Tax=Rhizobium sp. BE258 TaxID=2817722 RepID=UPI000DD9EECE
MRPRSSRSSRDWSTRPSSWFAVERRHFALAAKLTAQRNVDLGAGDALHLALAEETRAQLVTLDRRLADAGAALEIPARLI